MALRRKKLQLKLGSCNFYKIPDLLGISSANILGEWYAGNTNGNRDLLDLSGNDRHLTNNGGTIVTNSTLLNIDNNLLQAFSYDGATQYHSLAHADWMNVFDGDFTVSALIKSPSSAPGSNIYFFSHGSYQDSGLLIGMSNTGSFVAYLSKSSANVTASSPSTHADGLYHLVTVVRNSNYYTIYVDGVPGAPIDCSTYGIDESRTFTIGCRSALNAFWNSHISYTRLQNTAMTFSQIQKEVWLFQGLLGGISANQFAASTFIRSTTSYADRKVGTNNMIQVPANWPVKTSDDAILIEGSVTQVFQYTQSFNNAWWTCAPNPSGITADNTTAPDGTVTADLFSEGVVGSGDTAHGIQTASPPTITASSSYTISCYIKLKTGGRPWVFLRNATAAKNAWFNIQYGYKGTVSASTTSDIIPLKDGWYRIWMSCTSSTTTDIWWIRSAEADNDLQYTGDGRDCFWVWGAQLQTGAFPTTYIPRLSSTAVSRSADSLTYIPWKISKNLGQYVGATPRLLFLGSESLNGTTVTPTTGSYTFTKNGRPQNGNNDAEDGHFKFNGTDDYLSILNASGGSDFNPAGNFSVVIAYTSLTVSGTRPMFGKWLSTGDQLGWLAQQASANFSFSRTTDGTSGTSLTATCSSCLEVGKPVLITCSYSTTDGLVVRVDAITAATQAATGVVHPSTTYLGIGGVANSSTRTDGKLHYLAYYDNYVISATEHSNMYAAFKQDGILPLTMSATTPKTKLYIECEARGLFSSTSDIGANRRAITIGGNTGTATSNKNIISLKYGSDGKHYFDVYEDSDTTQNYIRSAAKTDMNKWKLHSAMVDFTNLANSTYYIDGLAQSDVGSMTGADKVISFVDCLIKIGQSQGGTVDGYCEIRNVKIWTK